MGEYSFVIIQKRGADEGSDEYHVYTRVINFRAFRYYKNGTENNECEKQMPNEGPKKCIILIGSFVRPILMRYNIILYRRAWIFVFHPIRCSTSYFVSTLGGCLPSLFGGRRA